jgi:hypothetical protein
MNVTTLRRLGWDAVLAAAYRPYDRPGHWPARVSRVEPGVGTLLVNGGVRRASLAGGLLAAAARDRSRLPCPGDWVVVRTWPDGRSTIETVLLRRGVLGRAPSPRPVASNVDLVVTVDKDQRIDKQLIRRLRALVAAGRTVGVVGPDVKSRVALLTALAGTSVLATADTTLYALPDGGAAISAEGDRVSIEPGDIDRSSSVLTSVPRPRRP